MKLLSHSPTGATESAPNSVKEYTELRGSAQQGRFGVGNQRTKIRHGSYPHKDEDWEES
jgi:hypothetical protein